MARKKTRMSRSLSQTRENPNRMIEEDESQSIQSLSQSQDSVHHEIQQQQDLPQQQEEEGGEEDDEEEEDQEEHEEAESQGTSIYLSRPRPSAHDSSPRSLSVVSRKGGKRKKPIHPRKRDAAQKKLCLLKTNLHPIPFTPIKTLDFPKHENLFKTLGLWEFAHIDFDRDIRLELLAQLIANYDSGGRCSYVKEHRINVNRADLGRALKLPVKKDKTALPEFPDSDHGGFSEESIAVIDEFMSTYMLLHGDTWMMPEEILASERLLKEGQPQKIDWARLIWYMVEKELSQALESGSCYYASHLQCLMKSQKPDIFKEEDVEEVSFEEDETAAAAGATITASLDAFPEHDLENPRIELNLGQETNEREHSGADNVMSFQEGKEEPGHWFLSERNIGDKHTLRHCNINLQGDPECERVDKEAEEERYGPVIKSPKLERLPSADLIQDMETNALGDSECEDADKEAEEERHGPSIKFPQLESLPSTDLIHDMETANVSYGLPVNLIDPSLGEFLTPTEDTRKSISLNPGGPSMFGDACKRDINDEELVRHISHNDPHGKLKNDVHWDHASEGFVICMEQAQSWLNKARAMHEEKDDECMRVHLHLEYLATEVQQRDTLIHSLQKSVLEERNKKQVEIYRLERELCVMTQLLQGYKKALKETRAAFAEYRERFQLPDEPMYKDVSGSGGLVLSLLDFEKQRLEREEEERKVLFAIEEKIKAFEQDWLIKFDSHLNQVDLFDKKLLKIVKEVEFLKENRKMEHPTT